MNKKFFIVIILAVVIMFVRLIFKAEPEVVDLVNAFSNEKYLYTESHIKAEAYVGKEYYTSDEMKEYVKKIAEGIGIHDKYDIEEVSDKDKKSVELTMNGKYAYTSVYLCSMENISKSTVKNYVYVEITIFDSIESANAYKNKLKTVFDKMGVAADISLTLCGELEGVLSDDEKHQISNHIINELEGELTIENVDEELFFVYGYSEGIDEYYMLGNKRVNINVAIAYDENENVSKVYVASPIIKEDF